MKAWWRHKFVSNILEVFTSVIYQTWPKIFGEKYLLILFEKQIASDVPWLTRNLQWPYNCSSAERCCQMCDGQYVIACPNGIKEMLSLYSAVITFGWVGIPCMKILNKIGDKGDFWRKPARAQCEAKRASSILILNSLLKGRNYCTSWTR